MMSLRKFIENEGVPIAPSGHHHSRPGWIQIDCPFCGRGSNKYHFGIPERGWTGNCYRCGPRGTVEALSVLLNRPPKQIFKETRDLDQLKAVSFKPIPGGKLILPKGIGPLSNAHRSYIKSRNLDPDVLESLWGVRGIGLASRLSWRLFIPITFRGETVSWTTRSIAENAELRYISASPKEEKICHKSILFGMDLATTVIAINEGPLAAVAIGPGGVATCGTGYTKEQLELMSRYPVRVVCFDAEPIAQRRAKKLCAELESLPGETYNVTFSAKAADDAPKEEIREFRKKFLD